MKTERIKSGTKKKCQLSKLAEVRMEMNRRATWGSGSLLEKIHKLTHHLGHAVQGGLCGTQIRGPDVTQPGIGFTARMEVGDVAQDRHYYFWNLRESALMCPHKDGPGWWDKLNSVLVLKAEICFIRLFFIKLLTIGQGTTLKRQFNNSNYMRDQQQEAVSHCSSWLDRTSFLCACVCVYEYALVQMSFS